MGYFNSIFLFLAITVYSFCSFIVIINVKKERLGLEGDGNIDVMNIKCGNILAGALLEQDGFLPAYHMNKVNWISIMLIDTVTDEEIFSLIELSYDFAAPKVKKLYAEKQSKADPS